MICRAPVTIAQEPLPEAIRTVAGGGTYVSPRASSRLAQQVAPLDLSRQQELLYGLLGQGLDAEAIAARLQVSPRTVETYCARLMGKLGTSGMKDLRLRANADLRAGMGASQS